MSENLKAILKKAAEWIALVGVLGGVGSLWIDSEVERRMNELKSNPGNHPVVVANSTRLETLEDGQKRIEDKVDRFSDKFLEYLERQAQ